MARPRSFLSLSVFSPTPVMSLRALVADIERNPNFAWTMKPVLAPCHAAVAADDADAVRVAYAALVADMEASAARSPNLAAAWQLHLPLARAFALAA
jgi:hypothetical protein